MKDVDEARSIATEVIGGLRGPDLSDDPSLPPLRRLEHAISEVSKADREVSPSKRGLQDKARVLKSEVTEENERIDWLVAAEGAELVRRFGTGGAAEKIADALDMDSVESIANMLAVRFLPKFGKDDDAVKLEFDEASAEEGSITALNSRIPSRSLRLFSMCAPMGAESPLTLFPNQLMECF